MSRLSWLEGHIDARERLVWNGFLGPPMSFTREGWWVDVDEKTGIAYGYVSVMGQPWADLTEDELPDEP